MDTNVRFSQCIKPAMKQIVLCLLAAGSLGCWFIFTAAGDEINAAANNELQRQDMDP
jgi:hypothetical protein